MIKLLGTAGSTEAAANGASAATNLNNATMVRCYNNHASNDVIVTLRTAADVTIGTFTVGPKSVEYLDKNITDEIYGSTATALFSSVIVMG